ncbi:MAG: hypothetical protein DMF39_09680 [Verrucomicrobia bacterium]|nr:MAG: hypothetical protein DMF39_09680 [Verrucomicrobiota bacterium]
MLAWYIKNYGADVNLFVDHSRSCNWNVWCRNLGNKEFVGKGGDVQRMTKHECSNEKTEASNPFDHSDFVISLRDAR